MVRDDLVVGGLYLWRAEALVEQGFCSGDIGSSLVGIELVGTGHGNAQLCQRVQDADGSGVGGEDRWQAFGAVWRFIKTAAAQDDVGALQPALHHLRLDDTFALEDALTCLALLSFVRMSVPGFQKTLLPILQFVNDGKSHRPADTVAHVIQELKLSDEDLLDRLANGRTRIMDRVLWAITYLRKSGLIESVSWGVFQITDRGRQLLVERPKTISLKDLERYPEYLVFKGVNRSEERPRGADLLPTQETPDEELQRTFDGIRKRLELELLDALKSSSPLFFEKSGGETTCCYGVRRFD